jgi:hypothetical protein
VPLARLPAEALAAVEPEADETPTERDPAIVSASMAAYARGLGGRTPDGSQTQPPYPPMTSTGNF